MAHIPRLYVPGGIQPGLLTLSAEQSKRLSAVMRVSPGEALLLFSGDGREWRATVASVAKQSLAVEVGELARQAPPPAVVLETWIGLIRAARFEIALEKCVEAGADIIRPVVCEFSQRGDTVSSAKFERWQRIVIEAAEQSGRLYLPVLQPAAPLTRTLDPFAGTLVFGGAEGYRIGRTQPLLPDSGHLGFLVGPEGGLSPPELAAIRQRGAIGLSLGPYILRTETAAIAGASVLRALTT